MTLGCSPRIDNELSFALLHLGYRLVSPRGCTLTTETMPTLRTLGKQRARWKRGALENLFDYRWTRHTRAYWRRQAVGLVGVVITAAYLGTLVYGAVVGMTVHPFWLGVTALFSVERIVTVRKRGPKAMTVAALIVIEGVYDAFLQAVQATVYTSILLNKKRVW